MKMTQQQDEVFTCVFRGDVETLRERLEAAEQSPAAADLLSGTDAVGRGPLQVAALLGRCSAAELLVTHGASVNQQTACGYTALHLAACWGLVDTVQTLLKLGADTKAQTFRGERPIDLAQKYSRRDCATCLILGEMRQDFSSYLAHVKILISESETSLNKEEKILSSRVLAAKTEWLQSVTDAQVSDYTSQRAELEANLQHILNKLAK